MSVVSSIRHYQKSIDKCQGDKARILHCINRLYDLPVTVQHLQDTGVGKTINSLRKSEGKVGDAARALVAKWKQMVEEESDNETEGQKNEEDPHKKHHEESDAADSRWQKDRPDKRDKHKSGSKAGSSYEREHLNDNFKENRKRKKENDYYHSKSKRQHIESEDEGIDEDGGHFDTTVDSDSEQLLIEETEGHSQETHNEYLQQELHSYNCENTERPSDDIGEISSKIKSERVSSDEEYQSSSKFKHSSSALKDSKHREKEGHHHRSHDKSYKKDRNSSDSKTNKKSSSHSSSSKNELRSERSSSLEIERTKNGSNSSSIPRSREKNSNSSGSRNEDRTKDKSKVNYSFDLKRVKSEFPNDGFDLKKVKSEFPNDNYDLKKVKSEGRGKESKPSSSSHHKEDKGVSDSPIKKNYNDLDHSTDDKTKLKDKEKKDKHKEKHHSKDDRKSKERKKEKDKNKSSKVNEDGVDSFSGTSFAEALGMCVPEKPKKKSLGLVTSSFSTSKSHKAPITTGETKTPIKDLINSPHELERQCAAIPLEPLDADDDFGLPTLNPNYKPLPQPSYYNSPPKKLLSEDEALTNIMYSKVQRTKVFSGNKTGYTSVPSLFDLCTRVLQENIDALEYTGGVPFDLLKTVLERATPDQLFTLEDYNAYLIEDTDVLWEFHCKKDFRNKKREEMETWREMYLRCREERERKLKALTVNITAANKAKALPVRKTQLAYVEGTVKPPRNIARKQAKFGTANASANPINSRHSPSSSSPGSSSLSASFTGRQATSASQGPAVSVPTPRGSAGGQQSSSCKPKPKAPLMQKALQLIKYNRFKR